jgi:hypothetical protein
LDRTMAELLVSFSLLGALFHNKLWMDGSSHGVVSHLSRLQCRVLVAWYFGIPVTGVLRWNHAGWRRYLKSS